MQHCDAEQCRSDYCTAELGHSEVRRYLIGSCVLWHRHLQHGVMSASAQPDNAHPNDAFAYDAQSRNARPYDASPDDPIPVRLRRFAVHVVWYPLERKHSRAHASGSQRCLGLHFRHRLRIACQPPTLAKLHRCVPHAHSGRPLLLARRSQRQRRRRRASLRRLSRRPSLRRR